MLSEEEIRARLGALVDNVGPPITADQLTLEVVRLLPDLHRRLLSVFNGFTTFKGAYRIFGVGDQASVDLSEWNRPDSWRFAWDKRLEPFLCFGETAWGDQYAYRSRPDGGMEEAVYFLEGTMLRPEVIATSFEEFLDGELIRVSKQPYDEMTLRAVRHFGRIDPDKHWVYTPSLALGGEESIDHVAELPAVTAMTFNGDVASALETANPGSSPSQVTPWVDDRGRQRLRLEFTASS